MHFLVVLVYLIDRIDYIEHYDGMDFTETDFMVQVQVDDIEVLLAALDEASEFFSIQSSLNMSKALQLLSFV